MRDRVRPPSDPATRAMLPTTATWLMSQMSHLAHLAHLAYLAHLAHLAHLVQHRPASRKS